MGLMGPWNRDRYDYLGTSAVGFNVEPYSWKRLSR